MSNTTRVLNTNIVLNTNQLLPFFVIATPEGFTDNYVGNQPLTIVIPFDKYLQLIKGLVKLNLEIINVPLAVLSTHLKANNNYTLLKVYYLSMFGASIVELKKSSSISKPCTRVFSKIESRNKKSECISFYSIQEYVENHFSEDELYMIHKYINSEHNIDILDLLKQNNNVNSYVYNNNNINMYYLCVLYYGLYWYNKSLLVNIKEE